MNYVLTGYSGLIGSKLDRKLELNGFKKLLPPFIVEQWTSPSTGKTEPDFRDNLYQKWLSEVKPDVFIHAGAIVGSSRCLGKNKDDVYSCNVEATIKLAEICKENDIYMVYFASDSEFNTSDYNRNKPISVNKTRSDPITYYGYSKHMGRLAVDSRLENSLILYPSFVFGDVNDGNSCIAEIIRHVLGDKNYNNREPIIPLDPNKIKQITPVGYVCDVVHKLIENKVVGKYPISSGTKLEYGEVVDTIRELIEIPFSVDWKSNLDYKGDLVYDDKEIEEVTKLTGIRKLDDFYLKIIIKSVIYTMRSIQDRETTHDWENIDRILDDKR